MSLAGSLARLVSSGFSKKRSNTTKYLAMVVCKSLATSMKVCDKTSDKVRSDIKTQELLANYCYFLFWSLKISFSKRVLPNSNHVWIKRNNFSLFCIVAYHSDLPTLWLVITHFRHTTTHKKFHAHTLTRIFNTSHDIHSYSAPHKGGEIMRLIRKGICNVFLLNYAFCLVLFIFWLSYHCAKNFIDSA